MTEILKQDLQNLKCEGNIATLPTERLNDYAGLKKTLLKANGKYKRNTFEFPYPAKDIISSLLSGKTIDFKKEFQFFETPAELADRLANNFFYEKEEVDVLEPSAGHGALIDALRRSTSIKLNIDAVELSELNYQTLVKKYEEVRLFKEDFLTFNPKKKYDIIFANPPFAKNQDIDHIRKMYSLLKEGGRLISLASMSWTFGSQKKQVEFREWLENDVAANWYNLDNGAFKTSGTNGSGTVIEIDK